VTLQSLLRASDHEGDRATTRTATLHVFRMIPPTCLEWQSYLDHATGTISLICILQLSPRMLSARKAQPRYGAAIDSIFLAPSICQRRRRWLRTWCSHRQLLRRSRLLSRTPNHAVSTVVRPGWQLGREACAPLAFILDAQSCSARPCWCSEYHHR
jgi:hypothetical protein